MAIIRQLVQIVCELGMRQAIFNLNMHGPDDGRFTSGMRDLGLGTAPSSSFGFLVAILAPYVGRHIHEVTMAKATLGDVEEGR